MNKLKTVLRFIAYFDLFTVTRISQIFPGLEKFQKRYGALRYKFRMRSWAPGYNEFREAQIIRGMSNGFDDEPFGRTLDERIVELPWVIAKLQGRSKVLDAGSALNHSFVLPFLSNSDLSIVTLYPEPYRATEGQSYIYSDLRSLDFKSNIFDGISCISTIEHIGFPNAHYKHKTNLLDNDLAKGGRSEVISELKRVLKKGGNLCVSGPYGKGEDYSTFRNLDYEDVDELVNAFEPESFELRSFLYTQDGWIEKHYRDEAFSDICYRSNRAAAAGSVFLLELVK
jgi:SAM-dependent methyltransferase